MELLRLLRAMFGQKYLNNIIGTKTNISKPIKLDKNSPFKLYSDSAFDNPEVLKFIEKKLAEYGPYALSNKNMSEVKNFEMNARRYLNKKKDVYEGMIDPESDLGKKLAKLRKGGDEAKKESQVKKAAEAMFGPLGKKPEAEVVDIRTQEKVKPEGIMKLKSEVGLPEGVEPGSIADKAIRESAEYKMKQQGVKSVLDEDYVPPKSQLTLEEEEAIADLGARGYSAVQEGKRRAVIRQVLLKDTRINLPDNVKNSLKNYDDLRGGGDPEMDPLKVFEDYYERDNEVLGTLDGIIDTAENEFKAADTFLSGKNFKVKKPMVRESLDDEAVEMEETKDLGEKLEDLPDDIDPDALAEGGRPGFKIGTGKEGIKSIFKMMNKKFGKGTVKMADEIDRPETALNREMFGEFNERMSRKILDVGETPPGFKLSRERLLKNFPEIDESMADEIMTLDRDLQLRVIAMLKDRRKNPEAYDKLLMEMGDTLDFQGEFDRSVRRSKNAGGGLSYLMGM